MNEKTPIKSLTELGALRDSMKVSGVTSLEAAITSTGTEADARPEPERAPFSVSIEGKQYTLSELREFLKKEGSAELYFLDPAIAKERGIDSSALTQFRVNYGTIKRGLSIIEKLANDGRPFSNKQAELEKILPSTIDFARGQLPKIKRVPVSGGRLNKSTLVSDTSTPAHSATEAASTLDTASHMPPHVIKPRKEAAPSQSKNGNKVEVHTIESTPYHSPDTNSLAELYDLPKLSPQGLEQILDTQNGPDTLKKNLSKVFKESLGGLSSKTVRGLEKRIPEFREADEMRKWLNFNIMSNAIAPGVVRTEDIAKYLELAKKLATSVENIPARERDALKETVVPQKTPDAAPMAPKAAVEKAPIVSFHNIISRMEGADKHIKDTLVGNPAALLTVQGGLYTKEYLPLKNRLATLAATLIERAEAAADPSPDSEQELLAGVAQLEALSARISDAVQGENIVIETPEEIAAANRKALGLPLTPPEPKTKVDRTPMKESYTNYLRLSTKYADDLLAHYTNYAENGGGRLERLGRLLGKLGFGGIRDSADLVRQREETMVVGRQYVEALHKAMDERMQARIATSKNPEQLKKWNEQLKQRILFRYVSRPLTQLTEAQENILPIAQRTAKQTVMSKVRDNAFKWTWKRAAVMAGVGALGAGATVLTGGTLGGAFALRKALSIGTGGTVGVAAAYTAGNYVEGRMHKTEDALQQKIDATKAGVVVEENGDRVFAYKGKTGNVTLNDFADMQTKPNEQSVLVAERINTTGSIGTKRTLAEAGAAVAAGGLVSYGMNYQLDKPSLGSQKVPDSSIGGEGGVQGKGEAVPVPEAKPVPEAVPLPDVAPEAPRNYTMVAGDNPWDLAEEKHFASKFEGMSNTERDHILDTVLDSLGKDDAMRQQVFPGYESDDFTRMPIGQEVNLDLYEKLLDKEIERHEGNVPRGLMDEEPSVNIEDRRTPAEVAADDRTYRNLMNEAQNADASVAFEGKGDSQVVLGESASENSSGLIDVSTEIDNLVDPKLVAEQREAIVISSLLSTPTNVRGAHDMLKEMTLGQIKTQFLNAPPAAWNAFAAQNNIDTASMTRWMEYLKQVSAADSSQVPTMKLDEYLDKVSEHIIKTAPARAA
jgi:hypothetical protein